MKKLQWWPAIGAVVAGLVLSGCGSGGGSSDTANVRVANATLTHPSLDLLVNSSVVSSATTTDTVSGYSTPSSGSSTLQLNDNLQTTALATTVPTLTGGNHYTLLAYESGGAVKTALLSEDVTAPTANTVQLRVYDTAVEAGKLDIYIVAEGTDPSTLASPTTSFTAVTAATATTLLTYSPGSYRVRITGYGNKTDIRADIRNITLASQQIATVVLTPATGGLLLNGSTVIQQGAYAATRNTNARVRLAAAVSGGVTVAASAGGSVIDSGSVAPAFGYYSLVPANSAINITVANQSVGAPTGTLTAGADYTLLVYGRPGAVTPSLILDDNRAPTDSATVKLRLINGITGTTGTLSLTANSALVGGGIAPGGASSYVSVTGSANAMNLILTSSLNAGILYQNTSNILNVNTVYTILAGGDISAPLLLIR